MCESKSMSGSFWFDRQRDMRVRGGWYGFYFVSRGREGGIFSSFCMLCHHSETQRDGRHHDRMKFPLG